MYVLVLCTYTLVYNSILVMEYNIQIQSKRILLSGNRVSCSKEIKKIIFLHVFFPIFIALSQPFLFKKNETLLYQMIYIF